MSWLFKKKKQPVVWKQYRSKEYDCDYYYNEEADETVWETPTGNVTMVKGSSSEDDEQVGPVVDTHSKEARNSTDDEVDDDWSEGDFDCVFGDEDASTWFKYYSDEYKCHYYYNQVSHETDWTHPHPPAAVVTVPEETWSNEMIAEYGRGRMFRPQLSVPAHVQWRDKEWITALEELGQDHVALDDIAAHVDMIMNDGEHPLGAALADIEDAFVVFIAGAEQEDDGDGVQASIKTAPTNTGTVPTNTEIVPANTETVSTPTEIVPATTGTVPTPTEIVPATTGTVPTPTEIVPANTKTVPNHVVTATATVPSSTRREADQTEAMANLPVGQSSAEVVAMPPVVDDVSMKPAEPASPQANSKRAPLFPSPTPIKAPRSVGYSTMDSLFGIDDMPTDMPAAPAVDPSRTVQPTTPSPLSCVTRLVSYVHYFSQALSLTFPPLSNEATFRLVLESVEMCIFKRLSSSLLSHYAEVYKDENVAVSSKCAPFLSLLAPDERLRLHTHSLTSMKNTMARHILPDSEALLPAEESSNDMDGGGTTYPLDRCLHNAIRTVHTLMAEEAPSRQVLILVALHQELLAACASVISVCGPPSIAFRVCVPALDDPALLLAIAIAVTNSLHLFSRVRLLSDFVLETAPMEGLVPALACLEMAVACVASNDRHAVAALLARWSDLRLVSRWLSSDDEKRTSPREGDETEGRLADHVDVIGHVLSSGALIAHAQAPSKEPTSKDFSLRTRWRTFMANVKFRDVLPAVFAAIRRDASLSLAAYINPLCVQALKSSSSDGGASGSLFLMSQNQQFLIKTVSKEEMRFFRRYSEAYYHHLKDNPNTLLCRFYGMHELSVGGSNIHFVVMNNFLANGAVDEVFDLKGSTINRITTEEEIRAGARVLKDLNFQGRRVNLGDDAPAVMEQLTRDVHFLRGAGIMDYSLLLGISETLPTPRRQASAAEDLPPPPRRAASGGLAAADGKTYHLGIIDIMQAYNWQKKIEHTFKVATTAREHRAAENISAVQVSVYADRFLGYVADIIK